MIMLAESAAPKEPDVETNRAVRLLTSSVVCLRSSLHTVYLTLSSVFVFLTLNAYNL